MGHGGQGALRRSTHLVDQNRLARLCGGFHELAALVHILQIDADDLRRVILKVVDEVGLIDVAFVADADNFVYADKVVVQRFHDQNGNSRRSWMI